MTGLENLLRKLKDELAELRKGEERRQRRLGWAIAAMLAGLLALGGGGWWAYQALSNKTDAATTVSTARIRAHLLKAVEDTYRRDLEAADRPADWQERERLRKAAEAQRRDTQLARIDDLAASFAEIERQGEATSVFKELTRILRDPGQGVAQALTISRPSEQMISMTSTGLPRPPATALKHDRSRPGTSALRCSALPHAGRSQCCPRSVRRRSWKRAPDWPEALQRTSGS